jgi:hypothetical protein
MREAFLEISLVMVSSRSSFKTGWLRHE